MSSFGFYGNRRSSSSSSKPSAPAESEVLLDPKVDRLISLVERLQREQGQFHQAIVSLTEKVDHLNEKIDHLNEKVDHLKGNKGRGKQTQKKLPTVLSVSNHSSLT